MLMYTLEISKPSQVKHEIHISFDPESEWGFKGLPDDWIKILKSYNISKGELIKNHQVLIDLLKIYEALNFKQKRPTTQDFEKFVEERTCLQEMDPMEKYQIKEILGHGATSTVFLCENKDTKEKFAMKVVKLDKPERELKIRQEVAFMLLGRNKNVIGFQEAFKFKDQLYIIVEYMEVGPLRKFIEFFRAKIDEEIIAYIIRETLRAIEVMHTNFQIHRDLKSDNILLSSNGDIKLADFGFSAQLTNENTHRNSLAGTVLWMAPELLGQEDYDERVDIWSLGIICLELCNGDPPLTDVHFLLAMYLIKTQEPPTAPERCSDLLKDFVQKCLVKDRTKRWTVEKLMSHGFLTQVDEARAQEKFREMVREVELSQSQRTGRISVRSS
eukprot:TRINITY_DN1017_c0_g2_i2.p1 TRINITY_DN1017_c0_g2~~TRINITY_DN1017_c0_g2_i2.p1  ORF type:complete len:386 (-),score=84.27 TRINITY_DN1017_c0_g2_i2:134-1291(-)